MECNATRLSWFLRSKIVAINV
uniref:Uncharacterized protein n=1 Tax=Anguilla anguilla TaxID=7936 RepID=A0A0E9V0S3_ANGAN